MSPGLPAATPNDELMQALRLYLPEVERIAGHRLHAVWLFGSFAREDAWRPGWPMHSDIDLLVVSDPELSRAEQDGLLDATYAVFQDVGRQVSPSFWSSAKWKAPPDMRARAFNERVLAEGRPVWPQA